MLEAVSAYTRYRLKLRNRNGIMVLEHLYSAAQQGNGSGRREAVVIRVSDSPLKGSVFGTQRPHWEKSERNLAAH